MSLTKDDLHQIGTIVGTVVTEVTAPRFDKLENNIESLARMTQEQFAAHDARFNDLESTMARVEDDVTVVKDMVKDHSFRLTRVEHRGAQA